MVEIANKTTAIVKNGPENEMYLENAAAVIPAPFHLLSCNGYNTSFTSVLENCIVSIKNDDNQCGHVQMTTVSINGSSKATKPSEAAYFVFTAECAMEAEPAPASLEKAARLNPVINTPNRPPKPACGLNA